MNLMKTSKTLVGVVLCSTLLTACANSNSANPFTRFEPASTASQSLNNTSLWVSMSHSFVLNHQVNQPAVQKQIAWLQTHQRSLYALLQSSAPYISYVYGQAKQKGIPGEIALLPIVESRFNPYATSPVGATGLWQIMPKTAPDLGLKSNKAYDGRRDIVASTHAALNYLNSLNQMFNNNWELALASYNWGPGNIQKAVKKQKKWYQRASYWSLKMPAETQGYVPKLLALAEVIQNPARYGITLPNVTAQPKLASVKVPAQVDLKQVAQAHGISIQTMQKLNPGYSKMATMAGAPNTLLVPIEKAQAVQDTAPSLAANTLNTSAATDAVQVVPAADATIDSDTHTLVKAILKQGQWLALGLADLPNLNVATV
ncbi:MAG: transglycosylase SLT domain-containing protein [Gammaproteobacteria bacterium]